MNPPEGLNLNILMDAACNNREVVAGLLQLFFELTAQEQTRLADAAAQGNAATVSAVAHKIAGSCSSCGMDRLAARFRELEHLCKEALPADIQERLKELDQELQDMRLGIREYFNCRLTS